MGLDDAPHVNQQVKSIVDTITVPIIILDYHGQILHANPKFAEILEYAPQELQKQAFTDFVFHERREFVQNTLNTNLQANNSFSLTTPLITKTKNNRTINWEIQPDQYNAHLFICTGKLLQDNRDHFELIAQNARDVFGILDVDGRTIYMNDAVTQITGWELKELIGKPPTDFMHPDDIEHVKQVTLSEFKMGTSQLLEYRLRGKNGHYVWFESIIRAVPNENGPPYQLAFTSRNIHARKVAQATLLENTKRYRWLMDNSTDMIGIYNPENICMYISPVCEDLVGYTPEEMLGQSVYAFIHEDDHQSVTELHQKNLEHANISTVTYRLRHKRGHYVWVETTCRSVRSPETGEVEELHTTTRDVTDRVIAQEQIRKSEVWHRQMFQGSQAVQILLNPDNGRILDANLSAVNFYGFSYDELTQMRISEINVLSEDVIQKKMDNARLQTSNFFNFQHQLANGDIRDVEVYSNPINMDGQIILYSIVLDVTEKRRSEAERDSILRYYRALFEKNNDAIFIIGMDRYIQDINHQAETLLRLEREEIIGELAGFSVTEPEKADTTTRFRDLLSGKKMPIYERTFQRKDGSIFIGEINLNLIINDDGTPSHIQSIVRDITERKQTENNLLKSELQYRTMIEILAEGVVLFEPDGSIVEFNQSALDILGLTEAQLRDELPRPDGWHTINADGKPITRQEHPSQITLATHKSLTKVLLGVYRAKDDLRWVQVNSRPLFHDAEQMSLFGVLVSFADITEEKQARDIISESEEKFRRIFENAPLGVLIVAQPNAQIITSNTAFQSLTGYSDGELTALSIYDISHPDDIDISRETITATLGTNDISSQRIEKRYIHKNGTVVWASVTQTKIFSSQNNETFLLAIIEDITQRKLDEQARIDLVLERQRTQVLTSFIRDASHEFRTPLSIINTSLYLSSHTNDPIKQQKQYDKIATQTAHINALVDELLLMSRLDSVQQLETQNLNVGNILHQIEGRLLPKATEQHIRLKMHINYNLPPVAIHAEYLVIAFMRLVENSIRYTEAGGEVTLNMYAKKNQVVITLNDTGIGIPPDELPKIFDRFFRLDDAHTTRGFGLGLSLAKRIIDLHGGKIDVESTLNKGTTFTISLPINT